MRRPHIVYDILALCFLLALALPALPAAGQESGGMSWSAEDCAQCHTDLAAEFARNPHSVLDQKADLRLGGAGSSCTTCHGDAAKHIEEGGGEGTIFAYGESATAEEKSQKCLRCHGDSHPRFLNSPHGRAGMDCTSCHSIHSSAAEPPLLRKAEKPAEWASQGLSAKSAKCVECHTDVYTEFQYNEHHRLQEGILDCTSCHDPHEPATRVRLGGFKQAQCIQCHADKGGPFVFEHGSVKVEGCVACHTPHGSVNRHMLLFQRTAELCFSCHPVVPSFHSRFTLDTVCTNCHSSIHGSNFSKFFLE